MALRRSSAFLLRLLLVTRIAGSSTTTPILTLRLKGNGGTRVKFEQYGDDYPLPEDRFMVERVTDDRTPRTMRS